MYSGAKKYLDEIQNIFLLPQYIYDLKFCLFYYTFSVSLHIVHLRIIPRIPIENFPKLIDNFPFLCNPSPSQICVPVFAKEKHVQESTLLLICIFI